MWYFAWVLGVGFACSFAILNALWLEAQPVRALAPAPRTGDGDRTRV
ncbi:cytochrome bd-I oxidase subunit CydX [Methylobacterium sp. sgz302541]